MTLPCDLLQSVCSPQLDVLNPQVEDSLFMSEAWMNSCIDHWSGRAKFRPLKFPSKDGHVATALLGERLELRHGVMPVRVLALNQSTSPELDEPWVERNGFFGCSAAQFEDHFIQMLEILSTDSTWDELRLSGLTSSNAREALSQAKRFGLNARLHGEQQSFHIDLQEIREQFNGDYLKALSPNTRQQLRRSHRFAESTLGPLSLETAGSMEQALSWFNETGPLHRARWGSTVGESLSGGFDNPAFVRFHESLIRRAFPTGGIQYLRLRAGSTVLTYLYNFVSGLNVHFYLSGINYQHEDSLRPGMLAHWQAVESNLMAGKQVYDFLAGEARYKRSLSTFEDRALWLVLQRPRLTLRLEAWARHAKRRWRGETQDNLDAIARPTRVQR